MSFKRLFTFVAVLVGAALPASAEVQPSSCEGDATCVASCARFDSIDTRRAACENVCGRESKQCAASPERVVQASGHPEVRAYSKKGEALKERELNGRMLKAIGQGNQLEIRRLLEMKKGLNPTYVYDFEFNPETRQYEGRAVKLRLADLFNDTVTVRSEADGLDSMLTLFIEYGLDVTATLPAPVDPARPDIAGRPRTAWGPSLKFMERARDRESRLRAFDLALGHGLKPNEDVGEWLFAELPEVCGNDRSEFAIRAFDLVVKHLGTSLQDDLWRMGERGPETVGDVLDRLMSPGRTPRSTYERNEFARMDGVWENCAPLSRRINRYLIEGR